MKRRTLLVGGGAAGAAAVGGFALRHRLARMVKRWTRSSEFTATPPLLPHDPHTERRTIAVARGLGSIDARVDDVLAKSALDTTIGDDDVVIIKVAAQWWNQGMTNVAAAKRVIEHILARPGFTGEIVVFENTHFRLANGSGLARAFTRPSERNVDVPGWKTLGDLALSYRDHPRVSFVGLIDAAPSELADDPWHDPSHEHGVYGGDGRGPIAAGEAARDGMRWDFERAFELKRGWFETSRTPLSWPVFSSPKSRVRIDLRDGLVGVPSRKLTWISLVTVNEHGSTGMTACCKSAMGVLDMSCGRFGTDPRTDGYQSVHYFGNPEATWRMAGPLAHFARQVRKPDLYVAIAEWVAVAPPGFSDEKDVRLEADSAHRAQTIVAGTDPVAIDAYCAKHVLLPIARSIGAPAADDLDLDRPDAKTTKFLRYYREVGFTGTLDESLVTIV
ncbi:MAG TPA: DUF362 domain-containing protein [Kofleriaceae bacterium]|nr:DUF362 domain-containing protein [Kofleriaceae bacterium]